MLNAFEEDSHVEVEYLISPINLCSRWSLRTCTYCILDFVNGRLDWKTVKPDVADANGARWFAWNVRNGDMQHNSPGA